MNYEEILLSKKNKAKKSKTTQKECVDILLEMFNETNDCDLLVKWLMELHYSVCNIFMDKFDISSDNAEKITNAFINNKDFKKNSNAASVKRGLSLCNALIKNNIEHSILSKFFFEVIRHGEKGSLFSEELIKEFKKRIIDVNLLDAYKILINITENENYKRTMQRLLSAVEVDINKNTEPTQVSADINDTEQMLGKNKPSVDKENKKEDTPEANTVDKEDNNILAVENLADSNKILDELQELKKLMLNQGNVLSDIVNSINEQEQYKIEIAKYKDEIRQKNTVVEELHVLLEAANKKIDDLDNKLKEAYSIDEKRANQELETLKINVVNSLMTEYKECTDEGAAIFNKDNFEANYASLQNIFRILKRLGFQFR